MNLDLFVQTIGEEKIKRHEKLAYQTFSKSSGSAEVFYVATTVRELATVLDLTHELEIPYFLIGNGTKVLLSSEVKGVVIKNRTGVIKVAGVKGKISKDGLGVDEAFIEADSGVSLNKLNEFLKEQKLKIVDGFSSLHSTVGGAIFIDPALREKAQSLKVWDEGEVEEIKLSDLKRKQIVLSAIFRFKSAQ
jgi:UDP-N-acetylmuramate dehydrogenase